MKTTIRALATIALLAFFLFIALSTSLPEDENSRYKLLLINTDENCNFHDFNFYFMVDSTKMDTLKTSLLIWPKDSLINFFRKENSLIHINYICDCPPDGKQKTIQNPVNQDTSSIITIKLACK